MRYKLLAAYPQIGNLLRYTPAHPTDTSHTGRRWPLSLTHSERLGYLKSLISAIPLRYRELLAPYFDALRDLKHEGVWSVPLQVLDRLRQLKTNPPELKEIIDNLWLHTVRAFVENSPKPHDFSAMVLTSYVLDVQSLRTIANLITTPEEATAFFDELGPYIIRFENVPILLRCLSPSVITPQLLQQLMAQWGKTALVIRGICQDMAFQLAQTTPNPKDIEALYAQFETECPEVARYCNAVILEKRPGISCLFRFLEHPDLLAEDRLEIMRTICKNGHDQDVRERQLDI